jgi:hypothetical protein
MQEILVFAIVLAAVAYLAFSLRASMRGKSGCGSCSSGGGCGPKKTPENGAAPLVQITMNGRALQSPASTRREK